MADRGDDAKAREFLEARQSDYRRTFLANAPGENVLADLAVFCRANASTFDADPRVHALLEGRREVWLRIQEHLDMDSRALYAKLK